MNLASGILPIAADTRKICLAWRSPKVREGNRWGVIGGMCKAGRSPEDSALLELAEETGYSGPIELHQAFVCRLRGFQYHNFIGIVPTAFTFDPPEEFAWETSYLEWMPYEQIQTIVQNRSSKFHKGLLQLLRESDSIIQTVVAA
jgi:8-oxo-dGTP pyrophosphatase MutT (NUDIX family)